MLEIYAKEFIGIATYLQKKEQPHKGYLLVEKHVLGGFCSCGKKKRNCYITK